MKETSNYQINNKKPLRITKMSKKHYYRNNHSPQIAGSSESSEFVSRANKGYWWGESDSGFALSPLLKPISNSHTRK